MLAGPSRWGQAPGRSAAHGRSLAGPVDPVRIPPLALDPYLVEQRYHRQHLRIFGVSNFVILDACLRPDQCWGVLAGLCGGRRAGALCYIELEQSRLALGTTPLQLIAFMLMSCEPSKTTHW